MDDQPCRDFFLRPRSTSHRRYEALRACFIEGRPPAEVAIRFGYKPAALKVLLRELPENKLVLARDFGFAVPEVCQTG